MDAKVNVCHCREGSGYYVLNFPTTPLHSKKEEKLKPLTSISSSLLAPPTIHRRISSCPYHNHEGSPFVSNNVANKHVPLRLICEVGRYG